MFVYITIGYCLVHIDGYRLTRCDCEDVHAGLDIHKQEYTKTRMVVRMVIYVIPSC